METFYRYDGFFQFENDCDHPLSLIDIWKTLFLPESKGISIVLRFERILCLLFTTSTLVLLEWQGIGLTVNGQKIITDTIFMPLIANFSPPTQQEDTTDGIASFASMVVISADESSVWVSNPDAGSISWIDGKKLEKKAEIQVGSEPGSLLLSPDESELYVVDRANGVIVFVDTDIFTVTGVLITGAEVESLALAPSGKQAYATVKARSEVAIIDLDNRQIIHRVPTASMPYAIAVSDDGDAEDSDETIYVTHFFSFPTMGGEEARNHGRQAFITSISAAAPYKSQSITLTADETGFPNLLAHIVLIGQTAWVPQVRASPDLPNELTSTLFAAVSTINLTSKKEDTDARLPLNDQKIFGSPVNNPLAVIPAPDGQILYVVLAGSDLIEVIDISQPHQPRLVGFLQVGKNPRGMAISRDGKRGYVMNYLSRSLTVLDLQNQTTLGEIVTCDETLSEKVLQGKVLFNNAVNPKLSHGSWLSCASCHPDGGTDSVTWIFPDGPRQTPPLWNATQTLPWHWSAALDEAQDVEDTIQRIQHGVGLAPGTDPPLLGTLNANRSADLDALAAYLRHGIRPPNLSVTQSATDEISDTGRSLFRSIGCADCHGGDNWTISTLPGSAGTVDEDGNGMIDSVLRQVGTLNPRDLRGSNGFDPPSLLALTLTAPYFHDGSAQTLEEVVASGHPNPHGNATKLTDQEIESLVAFLRQIDSQTQPIESR